LVDHYLSYVAFSCHCIVSLPLNCTLIEVDTCGKKIILYITYDCAERKLYIKEKHQLFSCYEMINNISYYYHGKLK